MYKIHLLSLNEISIIATLIATSFQLIKCVVPVPIIISVNKSNEKVEIIFRYKRMIEVGKVFR